MISRWSVMQLKFTVAVSSLFGIAYDGWCKGVASASPVLAESFDERPATSFGKALLKNRNIKLEEGAGVDGSKAIRVDYVGNKEGSERVILTYPLPRPALEYTLNFDVSFCPGFDFRKGGKLHGLGPARPVAGGNDISADRWSARLMFRKDGGLMSYVYKQGMKGKYGDEVVARHFRFKPGRYYKVAYHVRLNQPAEESNGLVRVDVDGVEVLRHENVRFRAKDTPDSLISTVMFNTFHGGHTPEWAPRRADGSFSIECAHFDNFAVYPDK